MTSKVEQWLPIAGKIVRGTYIPADMPLFDKETEAQILAEWLASHAPIEAALLQELAQLKAAYKKAIACVPTELLNLYFRETEAEKGGMMALCIVCHLNQADVPDRNSLTSRKRVCLGCHAARLRIDVRDLLNKLAEDPNHQPTPVRHKGDSE